MHYFKIVFLLLSCLLMSCGKPPLLNKLEKNLQEIKGDVSLNEKFSFTMKWIVVPNLSDLSSFELSLDKPLKDNQSLHAYIDMPEMGHGSSPIEMNKLNATDYVFTELAFIMPGLWVLHIELLENQRIVDQWQKSITL